MFSLIFIIIVIGINFGFTISAELELNCWWEYSKVWCHRKYITKMHCHWLCSLAMLLSFFHSYKWHGYVHCSTHHRFRLQCILIEWVIHTS